MNRTHGSHARPAFYPAPALLTPFILLLAGCVDFGYNQIELGQRQREYQQAFPEEKTRRTAAGLCYFERDWLGRTEAIIVLLTADRQVAGKLRASHSEQRTPFGLETRYQLVGELEPQLIDLQGAGPIDTLRVLADELTAAEGDNAVREAHGWVAAGLVRLVQHWPHVGDEGPAITRLTDLLERVPAGGEARITIDPHGAYLIEYTHTATR